MGVLTGEVSNRWWISTHCHRRRFDLGASERSLHGANIEVGDPPLPPLVRGAGLRAGGR